MRATANTDKQSNCRDAHKVLELTDCSMATSLPLPH